MKPLKAKLKKKMTIAGSPPWREEGGLAQWRGEEEMLGDFSLEPILNLVIVISLVTFLISGDIACGSLPLKYKYVSEPTLDRGRRRRRGRASFLGFFGRLRLNDDWRWGGGKVRPVTIITLMVVMMMMAMMVKMISNLLLGVGEGIGSVGWAGGFFDGLGGAGGTLTFEIN